MVRGTGTAVRSGGYFRDIAGDIEIPEFLGWPYLEFRQKLRLMMKIQVLSNVTACGDVSD